MPQFRKLTPAKQATALLGKPASEWPMLITQQIDKTRLPDVEDILSVMACRAAMLSAYISARYGHGCGDSGHEEAVKQANKQLVKVRKALGFTYPERGQFNF